MKTTRHLLLAITLPLMTACHKNTNNKACGCDTPTIQTIDQSNGNLFYNNNQKKYEIQIGAPGGAANYFICDSTFPQLHSIIDTNRALTYQVAFSGNIKTFCVPDSVAGYIDQMYNIELTKIEKP